MSVKKSLLLIEPFTAFPQTSGGRTRIFHTINELNRHFVLSVWSLIGSMEEGLFQTKWLNKLEVNFRNFPSKTKKLFSFLLTGQPYWFADSYSKKIISELKSEAIKFPVIQIEFSQLLYLVKYLPSTSKKIFVAHDIASISFWRRFCDEKNVLKKVLHSWRLLEVYFYERKYLPKFDLVIAVSKHDALILKQHFGLKQVRVIPNGVSKVCVLPTRADDGYINLGYIGAFSHAPNLEAVKFLLNFILPELEQRNIKYRFYLAGQNDAALTKELLLKSALVDKSAVKVLGYLDNIEDFYQQIDLLIAPIFAGSGTRIKILESLSYGRPVLTTKIGAEGIEVSSSFLKTLEQQEQLDLKIWTKEILAFANFDKKNDNQISDLKKELAKITWEKIFTQNYF